jgi:pimeloyl-ACP methyl ester carboxylesterase
MELRVPVDLGSGPTIVILHGFAMSPNTYRATAEILARRARVVIPDLFDVERPWRYPEVLAALTGTLDRVGPGRVTLIGHSFGGGLELGLAAAQPDRVEELVFSDTLAVSREWRLADEALRHPLGLLHLATPLAVGAFARSCVTHPRQLIDAAWWAFVSGRAKEIEEVAAAGLRSHVMWANRDSLLSREDGKEFARELGASFTVAESPSGAPVDHDWMFQQPELFVQHLRQLDLRALR